MTEMNAVFNGPAIRKPTSYSALRLMKRPRLLRLLDQILAIQLVVRPPLPDAVLPATVLERVVPVVRKKQESL
jgi:hypothetical protein